VIVTILSNILAYSLKGVFMKTEIPIKRYILIATIIISFLMSSFIAFITYRHYGIVARGISGFVLLYLLFYFIRFSNLDVSIDALLLAPKKGKYLLANLIVPIFIYWAIMQIYETILFFWKR